MAIRGKIYWVVLVIISIALLILLKLQMDIYIEYLNSTQPTRHEGLFIIALMSLYSVVLWVPGLVMGAYGILGLKKYWSIALLLPSGIEGLVFVWALLS
jgi:hypothetical protein